MGLLGYAGCTRSCVESPHLDRLLAFRHRLRQGRFLLRLRHAHGRRPLPLHVGGHPGVWPRDGPDRRRATPTMRSSLRGASETRSAWDGHRIALGIHAFFIDIGSGLWPFAHNSTNSTFGGYWNGACVHTRRTSCHTADRCPCGRPWQHDSGPATLPTSRADRTRIRSSAARRTSRERHLPRAPRPACGCAELAWTLLSPHSPARSFWCIMKAPLILGNDLAAVDNATLAVLVNADALSVNQDALWSAGAMRRGRGMCARSGRSGQTNRETGGGIIPAPAAAGVLRRRLPPANTSLGGPRDTIADS